MNVTKKKRKEDEDEDAVAAAKNKVSRKNVSLTFLLYSSKGVRVYAL